MSDEQKQINNEKSHEDSSKNKHHEKYQVI